MPRPRTRSTTPFTPTPALDNTQAAHLNSIAKASGLPSMAIEWEPKQVEAITSMVDEVGLIGGAGGGKSTAIMGAAVKGNLHLPPYRDTKTNLLTHTPSPTTIPEWINHYYVYHPGFSGLILRQNATDMRQFIERALNMWKPLGAEYLVGDGMFVFPSITGARAGGGKIFCGHLADRDAWQKYLGNEYVRIMIDELGLIPDESSYEEVLMRIRSPYPEFLCQMYVTSNFTGDGAAWVHRRFCSGKDDYGSPVEKSRIMRYNVRNPLTGETSTRTRQWIFSIYSDNRKMKDYWMTLAMMKDEKKRDIYLRGEPRFSGVYFDTFRTEPRQDEPPQARHVIPHTSLPRESWLPCIGSLDIGYRHNSAFYLARYTPQRQIIIFRELVISDLEYYSLGAEIARQCIPILDSPTYRGNITIHTSHDAFGVKGDRYPIDLLIQGAERVLGRERVSSPLWEAEQWRRGITESPTYDDFQTYLSQARAKSATASNTLIFERAQPDRVTGWAYVRELLRWRDPIGEFGPYSTEVSSKLLASDPQLWREYESYHRTRDRQPLPRLLIVAPDNPDSPTPGIGCPKLIRAIPEARHSTKPGQSPEDIDKTHFEGMDSLDALRYLAVGERDHPITPTLAHFEESLRTQWGQDPRPFQLGLDRSLPRRLYDESRSTTQILGADGKPITIFGGAKIRL